MELWIQKCKRKTESQVQDQNDSRLVEKRDESEVSGNIGNSENNKGTRSCSSSLQPFEGYIMPFYPF